MLKNGFFGTPLSPPVFAKTFAFLLAVDLAILAIFAVATALAEFDRIPAVPAILDITLDFSLNEVFGYLKWLSIVVALFASWRVSRAPALLANAALFAFVLLDDAGQLHERVGDLLDDGLDLPSAFGLRGQDLGELGFWLAAGVPTAFVLGRGFVRSTPPYRRLALILLVVLGGLAFTGAGLDMLSIEAESLIAPGKLKALVLFGLHLLEDGGESIVASVGCAVALAVLADHVGRVPLLLRATATGRDDRSSAAGRPELGSAA